MSEPKLEYMYNFENGGWNTELATSEQEAYDQAVERWKDKASLRPIRSSFKLVKENKKEYNSLMRSFW